VWTFVGAASLLVYAIGTKKRQRFLLLMQLTDFCLEMRGTATQLSDGTDLMVSTTLLLWMACLDYLSGT